MLIERLKDGILKIIRKIAEAVGSTWGMFR